MLIRLSLLCAMLFVLCKDCCLCRACQITHLWGPVRMPPERTAYCVWCLVVLVSCWAMRLMGTDPATVLYSWSAEPSSMLSDFLASCFCVCSVLVTHWCLTNPLVSSRICDKIHVFCCAILCLAHLIKPQKQWHKYQTAAGFFFFVKISLHL